MTLEQKATVNWDKFRQDALRYLDDQSPLMWRQTFAPLIQGVVVDQVDEWAFRLGLRFDVQNLFARDWFNEYMLKFAQEINNTTKEGIRVLLNRGLQEGWSIPNMQKGLTSLFKQYMFGDGLTEAEREWFAERLPRYRTEMIARTETIRASNAGTTAQYKEWGVQRRKWLATRDGRTRGSKPKDKYDHLSADGQEVGIDEPFIVTGEPLMYPGDPSGSPGNTINCRCTTYAVIDEDIL